MIVHWGKGSLRRHAGSFSYRTHCSGWIKPTDGDVTYSLDEITCERCLEIFVELKEKELRTAKDYLKILKK